MRKNIVLIGFMGTGKTDAGKGIAERLSYTFLDTDELIEKREGITISEIFEKYGEPYFRKAESEVIEEVSKKEGVVISTGGGAVIRNENRENLKRNGIMICLTADPEVIYERTKTFDNRPLLKTDDPYKRMRELMKEREGYYSQAEMTIDTTNKGTQEIVNIILERVGTGRISGNPDKSGRPVVK